MHRPVVFLLTLSTVFLVTGCDQASTEKQYSHVEQETITDDAQINSGDASTNSGTNYIKRAWTTGYSASQGDGSRDLVAESGTETKKPPNSIKNDYTHRFGFGYTKSDVDVARNGNLLISQTKVYGWTGSETTCGGSTRHSFNDDRSSGFTRSSG